MDVIIFTLLGLISGAISAFFAYVPYDVFVAQGIIFGIALSVAAYIVDRKVEVIKKIVFIVISTGTYYGVTVLFLFSSSKLREMFVNQKKADELALILAGAVGATILTIVYCFLIKRILLKHFLLFPILGGILALSYYLLPEEPSKQYQLFTYPRLPLMSLFLVWQTGIATALGWASRKSLN